MRGSHNGSTLKKIINDLAAAGNGYEVTPHLYKFEEYGVPQSRHRIILVGFRKDLKLKFKPPAPTHRDNLISCKIAITKPAIPPNAYNNEFTQQHPRVVERLKHILPVENAWTANLPEN